MQDKEAKNKFSLLSFNVLKGFESGPEKRTDRIIEVISELAPDLINLQELYPNDSESEYFTIPIRDRLRDRGLDYWYFDSGQMLSRYPRGENLHHPMPFSRTRGWEILTPFGLNLLVFNVHLRSYPFGPNYILWENDLKSPLKNAATRDRLREISAINRIANRNFYADWPIIVAGDFNSASHLDWCKSNRRFQKSPWPFDFFPWKESTRMIELGFTDSYRHLHKLSEREGITFDSAYWGSNTEGSPAERERIDFIYFHDKGKLKAISSETIGNRRLGADRHVENWPSDHSALLTTFETW